MGYNIEMHVSASMMFMQWNCLLAKFSEHIPIVKRHMTVLHWHFKWLMPLICVALGKLFPFFVTRFSHLWTGEGYWGWQKSIWLGERELCSWSFSFIKRFDTLWQELGLSAGMQLACKTCLLNKWMDEFLHEWMNKDDGMTEAPENFWPLDLNILSKLANWIRITTSRILPAHTTRVLSR